LTTAGGRIGARQLLVYLILLFGLVPSGALAQKRCALLIGNAAYQAVPKLINPLNDIRIFHSALKQAGFSIVQVVRHLGLPSGGPPCATCRARFLMERLT
jgi:hypothetical protein